MKRKGFWRTFESVLAVIILVFFVLALGVRYSFLPPQMDLSAVGYEILKDLDNRGELRPYVMNNQTGVLESKISIPGRNHAIQICDFGDACYGTSPAGENVWVSTYIIAGENFYSPREVRLLIW